MLKKAIYKKLIIGIGNSGRSDDGLGWVCAEEIKKSNRFEGDIELRYQLVVEDAELISMYNEVLFIDACRYHLEEGWKWEEKLPALPASFTSHYLTPYETIELCTKLYGKKPQSHLLLITGVTWGLNIGISKTAQRNLDKALKFLYDDYFQQVIV